MKGRFGLYIVGAGVLLALVGCGRSFLSGERAPWRHDAEVACMKSGSVKINASVVQVDPIEGPGMCGADFPLKVAALGESSSLVGYADDPRPPGSIPNGSGQMPRWPINEPQYAPPATVPSVQSAQPSRMRWVPGPPPAENNGYAAPTGQPVSLSGPGAAPAATLGLPQNTLPLRDDIPDDAELPRDRAPTTYTPRTYGAPAYQTPQRAYETPANQPQQRSYQAPVYQTPQRSLPPLGPARRPAVATVVPATLTPPATLACPIVSALDRWVSDGVQPAAMRWFGEPVTEIKQISAYSCRGMVGAGGSGISEHAFGNALDYRHVPSRGAKASRITVRLTPSCCARVPSVSSFAPGCSEPSPAQGATGLFNPANSSTTANAPTSGGLPANAMTSAQLADVSARPHLYPNVTPAQARAELDARAGRPYQGPAIPTMGTAPRATAPIDMPTYDQVP